MPIVLNGKALANNMEIALKDEVSAWTAVFYVPTLTTILVGDNPASEKYIRMKTRVGLRLGMYVQNITLPEDSSPQDVLEMIHNLNEASLVSGIMLQHPVPDHLMPLERDFFDAIAPEKDVDGVNSMNFGRFALGVDAFRPATPRGIMELLAYYKVDVRGLDVVVVGASPILGKPLAMMMVNAGATVTMCHSSTHHLEGHVRGASVIVGAAGVPNLIKADWVRPGAILIDAGCSPGNVGDIEKEAWARSSAYTPVPGGVGPMTIITLLQQTMIAARKAQNA